MENEQSFREGGALALEVPSLFALKDQGLTSACVRIGNLKWQLKLCKGNANNSQTATQSQQQYSIYAHCNEMCIEDFWFCCAKFAAYSKQKDEVQMAMINSTGPMNVYYGNSQLLIGSINPSKTHPILLIVEVQIVHVQPKMFALNTNIQVRMANGTSVSVAVNKQGLAIISTYFDNLFFAQQCKEFLIREDDNPAFDIDTFRQMIYGALSLSWDVRELLELFKEGSRMLEILKLAYKYDICPLIKYCENQLILDPKTYPPNSEMLKLAEQMNLGQLRNHCLVKINAVNSMENNAAKEDASSSSGLEKTAMEMSGKILKESEQTPEQKTNSSGGIWQGKYPKRQQLNAIVAKTGISEKRIKTWFNNQRLKEKKQCTQQPETASTEVDTDMYILEENNKNSKNAYDRDHNGAGSSSSVFLSSRIPGSSSCPRSPDPPATAINLLPQWNEQIRDVNQINKPAAEDGISTEENCLEDDTATAWVSEERAPTALYLDEQQLAFQHVGDTEHLIKQELFEQLRGKTGIAEELQQNHIKSEPEPRSEFDVDLPIEEKDAFHRPSLVCKTPKMPIVRVVCHDIRKKANKMMSNKVVNKRFVNNSIRCDECHKKANGLEALIRCICWRIIAYVLISIDKFLIICEHCVKSLSVP